MRKPRRNARLRMRETGGRQVRNLGGNALSAARHPNRTVQIQPGLLIRAFALLVVAGLTLPAAALADVSFSKPRTLSERGYNAGPPDVAVAPSGRSTVVWQARHKSSLIQAVQAVRLSPKGRAGSVKTVSELDSGSPRVAVDDSATSTIVWSGKDGVQSARFAADGTPGPVQTLAAGYDPDLGIDDSGRATIAWVGSDGGLSQVQSMRLGAEGTPGPVQTLSGDWYAARGPQIALSRDSGQATVLWLYCPDWDPNCFEQYGYNGPEAVLLDAGGIPGPVHLLGGYSVYTPDLAIDGSDRATVVWEQGPPDNAIGAARLSPEGAPDWRQTLSKYDVYADSPQVAANDSERAWIVWNQDKYSKKKVQSSVQLVRLSADGTPGHRQSLAKDGNGFSSPRLAIDSAGRATVAWVRDCSKSKKDRCSVVEAVRVPARRKPGRIHRLSKRGRGADEPEIAIDSSGRTTIVWSIRKKGDRRIQSVKKGGR
jgi:hypothetical protein